MDTPPATHMVYIPMVLLLGMVLGFLLGRRSSQEPGEGASSLFDDDLDDY